ncbi:hypothetical protein [Primorskyibacter sp. S87]|uniref:hypothetical protein n=1 Tax=Primorskyibacter sp. S87 TaxID=3415126 RepID=UPI003C7BC172
MFRSFILAVVLSASGALAQTSTQVSDLIAANGLEATALQLNGATSAEDRFALGGVLFLRAIEESLQTRWQHGMSRTGGMLPVLRLPVAENPDPDPFRPELIVEMFAALISNMEAARAQLDLIGDGDEVSIPLSLGDVWFDVNMDGQRSPQEGLLSIAGTTLGIRGGTPPTIQFDTADAAWLSAYTHLLAAVGDLVLAFNPTPQIDRILQADREMESMGGSTPYTNAYDMMLSTEIDLLAIAYFSLGQQPDPVRTRAARENLLAMIRKNRVFWARVEAETDNFAEWIPNSQQVSALGIPVPPETGERWLNLLSDGEDLLEGRKLIPFWRLRSGAGLNLLRLMEEPPPVDIAAWAHGIGLLPYFEDGERISTENWWLFQDLVSGDAALFAVWLN